MTSPELIPKYQGRGAFEPKTDINQYILGLIQTRGPLTRSQLKDITRIPRTTIYDTIVKLILDEKIRKYKVPCRSRGRPRVFYEYQA